MLLFWCQGGLDARTISLLPDWISCLCTACCCESPCNSSVYCTGTGFLYCVLPGEGAYTTSSGFVWAHWVNICQNSIGWTSGRFRVCWDLTGVMVCWVPSSLRLVMCAAHDVLAILGGNRRWPSPGQSMLPDPHNLLFEKCLQTIQTPCAAYYRWPEQLILDHCSHSQEKRYWEKAVGWVTIPDDLYLG